MKESYILYKSVAKGGGHECSQTFITGKWNYVTHETDFGVFAKAVKLLSIAHKQICSLLFEVCRFMTSTTDG